ncbi:MAG: hypothetical protein ACLQFR_04745 [Streptosporangiaceae bacterium]
MRREGWFALLLVAALVMCGCGTAEGNPNTQSSSRAPSRCAYTSDVETTAYPLIEMEAPRKATWQTVPSSAVLPCNTRLSVAAHGTAGIRFGVQAHCTVRQDPNLPAKTAMITTRQPVNAFFNQDAGSTWCTIKHSTAQIPLCGMGTVLLNGGTTQVRSTCNREPDFDVAVLTGSVSVIDPAGVRYTVEAGEQLSHDFLTNTSAIIPADFSATDVATFDAQALAMSLAITQSPQVITFTSTPPANPTPGETYLVTATGGGSGNRVVYAIDPSSGQTCTISQLTSVVTFLSAGMCIIDANQAGDTQFLAAQQVQQSVTVASAPLQ